MKLINTTFAGYEGSPSYMTWQKILYSDTKAYLSLEHTRLFSLIILDFANLPFIALRYQNNKQLVEHFKSLQMFDFPYVWLLELNAYSMSTIYYYSIFTVVIEDSDLIELRREFVNHSGKPDSVKMLLTPFPRYKKQ